MEPCPSWWRDRPRRYYSNCFDSQFHSISVSFHSVEGGFFRVCLGFYCNWDFLVEERIIDSMWQLGLGSESYPERPGVPNCVYYMRTGFCGYGSRCRYNHPRDRAAVNPYHKFSAEVFSILFYYYLVVCYRFHGFIICFDSA